MTGSPWSFGPTARLSIAVAFCAALAAALQTGGPPVGARSGAASPAQEWPPGLPLHYQYALGNADLADHFGGATDLAVAADGSVVLTDSASHRVAIHAPDGRPIRLWGAAGDAEGRLTAPAGLAIARDGTVFVADTGNSRIVGFDARGRYIRSWDGWPLGGDSRRERPFVPVHVAVAPDGTVVTDDALDHHVLAFAADGTFVARLLPSGPPGDASAVDSLAVAPDGTLYVALRDRRVQVMGLDGTVRATWPIGSAIDMAADSDRLLLSGGTAYGVRIYDTAGSLVGRIDLGDPTSGPDGRLLRADAVATDPDGTIRVLDGATRDREARIHHLSASGAHLGAWQGGRPAPGVMRPSAIAADEDGRLFAVDTERGRVQPFAPDGRPVEPWPGAAGGPRLERPVGVACGRDGYVYVTDPEQHLVVKFAEDGRLSMMFGGSGSGPGQFESGPTDIDVTRSLSPVPGRLWIVDPGASGVQTFDPDGSPLGRIGSTGDGYGQFCAGCADQIAVDLQGDAYVSDRRADQRIQVFGLDGRYLRTIHGLVGEDSRFAPIADLSVGLGRRLYVADPRGRVQVIGLGGDHEADIDTLAARPDMRFRPDSVAASPHGASNADLFVGDGAHGLVHVLGGDRQQSWRTAFHDNPWLAGPPVAVTTTESLSFDWHAGSPGGLPVDGFSLRAEREVAVPAGRLSARVSVDGGVRLWIDDRLLVDDWDEHRAAREAGIDVFQAGRHRIVLEYVDLAGPAAVRLVVGGPLPTWTAVPGTPAPTATSHWVPATATATPASGTAPSPTSAPSTVTPTPSATPGAGTAGATPTPGESGTPATPTGPPSPDDLRACYMPIAYP